MTRSLRCVSTKVRDIPTYDGLGEVDSFLDRFERKVTKKKRFQALNWVLRATTARWWGTHRRRFEDWRACRKMLRSRFGKPIVRLADKYNGRGGSRTHLSRWVQAYGKQPTRIHMSYVLGNTVNKHVLGGKMREQFLKLE